LDSSSATQATEGGGDEKEVQDDRPLQTDKPKASSQGCLAGLVALLTGTTPVQPPISWQTNLSEGLASGVEGKGGEDSNASALAVTAPLNLQPKPSSSEQENITGPQSSEAPLTSLANQQAGVSPPPKDSEPVDLASKLTPVPERQRQSPVDAEGARRLPVPSLPALHSTGSKLVEAQPHSDLQPKPDLPERITLTSQALTDGPRNPSPPAAPSGTWGAKHTYLVNYTAEKAPAEGQQGQILPGGSAAPDAGLESVDFRNEGFVRPEEKPTTPVLDSVAANAVHLTRAHATDGERVFNSETQPIAESAATRSVSSGILDSAIELKQSKAESISVVLRPDPTTELHLQLHLRRDFVDVSARMEMGDSEGLRAEWHRLQETLAEHGIRVSALHDSSSANLQSSGHGAGFQQPHQRAAAQHEEGTSMPDRASLPSRTASPSATSRSLSPMKSPPAKRSFETWA
jgi:hypothetical protein